ncbi:hypothetical protein D9R12_12400 [Pseudoxanthomonas spadix]|nr:hypothetical protein D9R12_12400 [Pseudoxanthomonas spadix]
MSTLMPPKASERVRLPSSASLTDLVICRYAPRVSLALDFRSPVARMSSRLPLMPSLAPVSLFQ